VADQLTVTPAESGQRLDRFLVARIEGCSPADRSLTRSQIKNAIDAGAALVDGKAGRAGQKLKAGQVVAFTPPPPTPITVEPEEIPLEIVFEDAYLVVVDKPPGLVVHPSAGHATGTLVAALLAHCRLGGGEDDMRPGIVHRIDKDTSGLLVVTKDVRTHEGLARQFRSHTIGRRYLTLVRGQPRPEQGRIVTAYGRHPHHRLKFSGKFGGSREAVTRYEVIERFGGAAALVACELETGRTHQVRVHLSELGHPVLGDQLYGGTSGGDPRLRDVLAVVTRQLLHAARLAFDHPATGERIDLESALPADFERALAGLRGLA
jgi:23S rRNA pseudouridine1911/1915/1917 synthase